MRAATLRRSLTFSLWLEETTLDFYRFLATYGIRETMVER
jgi:hypothetical protein